MPRKTTTKTRPAGTLLTTTEVAERLRLSPRTLENWRLRDPYFGPRYVHIGGRTLYPEGWLSLWLEEQGVA